MKVFFTSDTHFGHGNIIEYAKRPFKSVEEMDEAMIENWNSVVCPEDLVYHLGDFCLGVVNKIEYAKQIRNRLKGDIRYIMGNHDPKEWRLGTDIPRFLSVKDFDEVVVGKQKISLFHYPMRTWHHGNKGAWHLYGHVHGMLPGIGKSLDVGVDAWNFTPVSFDQLKEVMELRVVGAHTP